MAKLFRVLALFPLLSSGCLFGLHEAFDEDPKSDGESCDEDDDCESSYCRGGMCTASSCDTTAECESGFVCDEPADWEEGLSFGLAKGACIPTCDRCPFRVEPRWICGGDLCGYDASPWVDAGEMYEGIAGDPIAVRGEVELDDGRELVSAEWHLQGTVVASGLEAELVIDMPGTWTIDLLVTDDGPSSGSASATIVVCGETGASCWSATDCCEGLACSETGTCG
jgi:hypothetical protein